MPTDQAVLTNMSTKLKKEFNTYNELDDLIGKMETLCTEIKEGQFDYYNVVAELLEEIHTKIAIFQQFSSLPSVDSCKTKLLLIETELKKQVQWSLRELGSLVPIADIEVDDTLPTLEDIIGKNTSNNLTQAYVLVNVLGKDFRHDLLYRFAQLQLLPYEKYFKCGTPYAGIDYIEKRFNWYKRLMKLTNEVIVNIFPPSWCVQFYLYCEFIKRTKQHISDVLNEQEELHRPDAEIPAYVGTLIKTLKSFIAFETECKNNMKNGLFQLEKLDSVEDGRYSEVMLNKECDTVSDAFDGHLTPYVLLERQNLTELVEGLLQDEEAADLQRAKSEHKGILDETTPEEKDNQPYESSQRMFEYIKASVKRCSALSTGGLIVSLSKEYRIALQDYCMSLKSRCPASIGVDKNTNKPMYGPISEAKEAVLYKIITTAEYCADIVPQLEGVMKQVVKLNLVDEITFEPQVGAYYDLVSYAIGILVSSVMTGVEEPLRVMRNYNMWAKEEYQVEDCSAYVKSINQVLRNMVIRMRTHLSPAHFNVFCNKTASTLLELFRDSLYHCKRKISRTSGSQLLLDVNSIKEALLDMPSYKLPAGESTKFGAYRTIVNKSAVQLETICK